MGRALDVGWALAWMRHAADRFAEHRAELIELDRRIGDGDHGENMHRGFTAVRHRLEGLTEHPGHVGDVLRTVATTLVSTVGGAAGPLFGTALLRAADTVDVPRVDGAGVAAALQAALDGVVARGRAEPGEKTMVDALAPAAAAAQAAAARGDGAVDVLAAAAEAARTGAVATEPLRATKGRASYLGERSIGHQDPGAVSVALLLRAGVEAAVAGVEA